MPDDCRNNRLAELLMRWEELREEGLACSAEELCGEEPQLAAELCRRIAALRSMEGLFGTSGRPAGGDPANHQSGPADAV